MYDLKSKIAVEEAQRVMALLEARGLADDAELVQNTLDGETTLPDLLAAFIKEAQLAKAEASASREVAREVASRAERKDRKHDALRGVISELMGEAGIGKLDTPSGTLSLSPARPKAVVTDESLLPEKFWRVKREIDRVKLGAAVKNGEVPGVTMSNGGPDVLTVRTK